MSITGAMLIGEAEVLGNDSQIKAVNPATDEQLEPAFKGGSSDDVEKAASLARDAFPSYRETTLEQRAMFLEEIADQIMSLGDVLIERAQLETGLTKIRLEGERARTVNQLRLFAAVVRSGSWIDARIDLAQPERKPMARSDIRLRHIPLGPVAVFGASNFPLAFSVAGGDTASALAAGAPVIVKAHSAHPGTSELVGRAVRNAVVHCDLHPGVFSLLFGVGNDIGQTLVTHPFVKAVAFTGSRSGGVALMHAAASRAEPIPVYAEMSSINPVFLLPRALQTNAAGIAKGFVESLTGSAGQLCTNPGLIIGVDSPELKEFMTVAREHLEFSPALPMLTSGIFDAYQAGVQKLVAHPKVELLAQGRAGEGPNRCTPTLMSTTAEAFMDDPVGLGVEVFGACSLVLRCSSVDQMVDIVESMEGQLTATLHIAPDEDHNAVASLISILETKVGRILANGYPTGVEVGHAMVHGGPFPATSDSRTTSVGTTAIRRFLRPVCYQDIPDAYLSEPLKYDNPLGITRMENP